MNASINLCSGSLFETPSFGNKSLGKAVGSSTTGMALAVPPFS